MGWRGGEEEHIKEVTQKCLPWSESFATTVNNFIVTDFSSLRYEIMGFIILGGVVVEVFNRTARF